MKFPEITIQHLFGSIIFGVILLSAVFIENIEKFPFFATKLPMRMVVTAKQEVTLYQCQFQQRTPIKTLKSGETAEFEYWACPYRRIKLSDASKACYLADDDDKVELQKLKFYYF